MKTDANQVEVSQTEELLIPLDDYLLNGIHVGLKYKTKDMKPFIYKVRPDKLCVFDVQRIDERIRIAVKFICKYKPEEVVLVSNRVYGRTPIQKFAECTGCTAITNRFVSGTLTNPNIKTFVEPKLMIVTDPTVDQQAIKEASKMAIPIIAICDSNTRIKNIDFVIPGNNKGKNSLALLYWIFAREISKNKDVDFNMSFEDFISQAEPQSYILKMQEQQRLYRRGKTVRRGKRR